MPLCTYGAQRQCVGPGYGTQVFGLGGKHLYLLSYLTRLTISQLMPPLTMDEQSACFHLGLIIKSPVFCMYALVLAVFISFENAYFGVELPVTGYAYCWFNRGH